MSTTTETNRGGSFLIKTPSPEDVFTPEDFGQEAMLLAQTTREFVDNEVRAGRLALPMPRRFCLTSLLGERSLRRVTPNE